MNKQEMIEKLKESRDVHTEVKCLDEIIAALQNSVVLTKEEAILASLAEYCQIKQLVVEGKQSEAREHLLVEYEIDRQLQEISR